MLRILAVARFPKPDFTSGYQYPEIIHGMSWETFWSWVDVVLLVGLMSLVAWAVHRRPSRRIIFAVSVVSVLYFGFFRTGCVCSIGSIQNVVLALGDSSYRLPLVVLVLFLLPLFFALFFGRVFCAGVCPMGALQELVNVRNFRISRAVASALSFFPWIYLGFAILYAATRSQFIICRFDPFVPIFRLSGDVGMIVFGVSLLVLSVFVGRPFCRFLCPYGAILGVVSSVATKRVEVTKKACINCTLCHNACPVDAIREPYANKGGERRMKGVRRVLLYLVMLPLLTFGGGWLLSSQSDTLSIAHRDVYLYTLLQEAPSNLPPEVEAFHEMGRSMEDLEALVVSVRENYYRWAWLAGALIGFVLGCKLIRLSVKRTRKTYEIEPSACVACGKCFDYCPQNIAVKNE
jgi:polyferredoxin